MIAAVYFSALDWIVLLTYFSGIIGIGLYFWRRNNSAEQFTAGGRTLSGWLCGLSIFATYLSSISYLGLPGKAFVDAWQPFVYSLAIPVAALIAVMYFVPLYRRSGQVSAYSWLEERFGLWARIYASSFYLLFQIARIGVVMYLMALPMAVLFGWDIRLLILLTGCVVTGYAFIGGIVAVIWADAIQAIVLLLGALLALGILFIDLPGGPQAVFATAADKGKFSLGDTSWSNWTTPTILVVLAYGLFDNLRNFGVDQSYIQRYIASRTDREAIKSVWVGALLYVPVSALFLFIGTSLFAYYQSHPGAIQEVRVLAAEQRLMQAGVGKDSPDYSMQLQSIADKLDDNEIADRVFPHFIATRLPTGVRGLLIAAIFAAAMSTVSTSLNSAATLIVNDFYQRLLQPTATDQQQMFSLRLATITWGFLGTGMAIVLVRLTDSALDVWWTLSSVLGAGIVGLFLLGLVVPTIRGRQAVAILLAGTALIAWMAISPTKIWPESLSRFASPLHSYLVIVLGPCAMILMGWLVTIGSLLTTKR